jgi:hypothetical protein
VCACNTRVRVFGSRCSSELLVEELSRYVALAHAAVPMCAKAKEWKRNMNREIRKIERDITGLWRL